MSISKSLPLPRPLNLPKPAPTAQASTQKPAAGVAGHASAPQGGIKPNAKPQGEVSGPPRGGFNPNAKPSDGFFETGGWANRQPATGEVNGPRGVQNLRAGGITDATGPRPTPPQPWTTYGEAIEQNREAYEKAFGDKGTYDLGAAFDKAFGQGTDIGFSGGAETKPGGGWGDLIEANRGTVPPGFFENK